MKFIEYSTTVAIKGVVVSARFSSTKRVDADREVAFIADENSIRVKSMTLNDQSDSILNVLQDASTYPAEDTNSKPLSRSCRAS